MSALATVDIGRLAKLCGMFSSDHLGERAAAAAKADAMVRAAGLVWADVLVPAAGHAQKSWRRELTPAVILATYGAALSSWEKCFLATLVKRPHWTDRQREVLAEIRARFK